ncbi:MAG: NADPH:quinone reductase [Solirubrobacteraceae bacterium]|jgi:NADPH2:quinone reductase|nr:NADPH:quinone reductase [Solirubrobacteraceae bacterium]
MLAARYETTGPAAEVLRVQEMPTPEPGPGEVLVRIAVSGVNPTDFKSRSGATGQPAGAFQIPDQDGAGTIEAVGERVDPRRVGERVWLYFAAYKRPWGTAAQYTVIPSEQAVRLPDGVSDELGASLGIPALTAHRCLLADGPIDGRTVLVAGGAGSVGHAAIELADFLGANVIATVSGEEKAALARKAGAHHVVNYRHDDAADQIRSLAPDGVHRVVEVALGQNLPLDVAVCARNAAVSVYADDGPPPQLQVRRLMGANLVLRFVLVYAMGEDAVRAAVRDVTAALEAGALTPLPLHRFPLQDTAAAHDAVESGTVGKVLIDVG